MAIFFLIFILAASLPSVPAEDGIFAVQWGSSVCQAEYNTCRGPRTPTKFTIQSLWYPSIGCRVRLTPHDIADILGPLKKSWPDVFYYGDRDSTVIYFYNWSEAWRNYGCSSKDLSPKAYFQLSLKLYQDVGRLRADLSNDECRPGQSCNLAKALETYDRKYPDRLPMILCTVNKSGQDQLQEVRFKVSATGSLLPLGGERTMGCHGPTALFPSPVGSMLTEEEVLPEALLISQII